MDLRPPLPFAFSPDNSKLQPCRVQLAEALFLLRSLLDCLFSFFVSAAFNLAYLDR